MSLFEIYIAEEDFFSVSLFIPLQRKLRKPEYLKCLHSQDSSPPLNMFVATSVRYATSMH